MAGERPKLSAAMEDYLKAVFLLQEAGETVTTATLAERLRVAAPSVTSMIKRLDTLGLVQHPPYKGIDLTATGRLAALEVVRHHRLIELYLTRFLDVPWDQVHVEAERLEHVLSEDLETRMALKLGQPSVDPHGHPIPSEHGTMANEPTSALWDVAPGESVTIARVSDRDPGLLSHLGQLGLVPGAFLNVKSVSPYSGTMVVTGPHETHTIGSELARIIRVRLHNADGTGESVV